MDLHNQMWRWFIVKDEKANHKHCTDAKKIDKKNILEPFESNSINYCNCIYSDEWPKKNGRFFVLLSC